MPVRIPSANHVSQRTPHALQIAVVEGEAIHYIVVIGRPGEVARPGGRQRVWPRVCVSGFYPGVKIDDGGRLSLIWRMVLIWRRVPCSSSPSAHGSPGARVRPEA